LVTLEHFFYFQEKFDMTRNGTHVNNLVNSKLHVDFTIVKTSCFLLHFIVTRYDFFFNHQTFIFDDFIFYGKIKI
jgi:hypothetical protein